MDRPPAAADSRAIPTRWAVERDQVVVLRGVSWAQYVALSNTREKSQPRMAYLDGELEIVTTSLRHEVTKTMIRRLVECYVEELGGALNGGGSTTFRKKAKKAGVEPDECYWLGRVRPTRPDLAIEVAYTSGGIDKLEVYRRLGVAEVWFWIENQISVYCLAADKYPRRTRSEALPDLDLTGLARIVSATGYSNQTGAVRAYRRNLRDR